MKRKALIVATAVALIILFWPTRTAKREFSIEGIRLVLFLVADQFPQEYTERFRPLFSSGLKTLLDSSVSFQQAHYYHTDTATCPGHATLATGAHPNKTGIVANWWYDRVEEKQVYCVEDSAHKRSPKRLRSTSLSDWMKADSRLTKAFSISRKDRSAIMMGGIRANAAYWYDDSKGHFVSSSYYQKTPPRWVESFNNKDYLFKHFGSLWTELQPLSPQQRESYGIVDFDEGAFPKRFPHRIGDSTVVPNKSFYSGIGATPFIDHHTTQFAKALISEEQLGQDETPDYLAVSFSALDSVGHAYGPNSREVLDTLRRLDLSIGELLDFIDESIGLEHVLVVMSSDHGVQAFPEYRASKGEAAHRQNPADVACFQNVGVQLRKQYKSAKLFDDNLYINEEELSALGIIKTDFQEKLRHLLEACPLVEKAWIADELHKKIRKNPESNFLRKRYLKSYDPKRSPDILLQLKQHHLHTLHRGTGHGSPYPYDTHVPLLFFHERLTPKAIDHPVRIVDAAPTMASLIGLRTPRRLDGEDLAPRFFR